MTQYQTFIAEQTLTIGAKTYTAKDMTSPSDNLPNGFPRPRLSRYKHPVLPELPRSYL